MGEVAAVKKVKMEAYLKALQSNPFDPDGPPPVPTPKKLLPIEPLTQAEWDNMGGKARWDSQVALRGPDLVSSQIVKWFSTSIIRHRMSAVMRVGGLVNSEFPFIVIPSLGYRPNKGRRDAFDFSHFVGHVFEAANWLGIPVAHVPFEAWKATILAGMDPLHCIAKLHGWLPSAFKEEVERRLKDTGVEPEPTTWLTPEKEEL